MAIALRYALRSDVGLVRSNNQDSGFASPNLLVVADGMGGHAGGDVASSIAVANLAPLAEDSFGTDDALAELGAAIDRARDELILRSEEHPELAGMGTTVTAILRAGTKLAMAHMGDSRAYLLRNDELTQVTTDHTFVQHLVDTGRITPEEAEVHPQRSVVMRVLGDFGADLVPDFSIREAQPGDRWLLCSDGLSGYVSRDTITQTLVDVTDPDSCVERLVQLALRAGGPDNITCIVADVLDPGSLPDGAHPTTSVEIAGAAALDRNRPSAAADGPAARAAALVNSGRSSTSADQEEPAADEEDQPEPAKRRRGLGALVTLLVLVLVGGAGYAGYRWTQEQYYVGVADGYVAIYRGIPQTAGPWHLSSVYELSAVAVEDLPENFRDRLDRTMPEASLSAARTRVVALAAAAAEAEPEPSAEQTPSPSPSPSTPAEGP
ncbi:MAG: Stp1/IreP family PP2C-type Ser/Thr phosphatase [Cellulomonadaceae bacterium]